MSVSTLQHLESHLEEFFRTRVRLAGGYTIKLAPTERGVPDRLVILFGTMYLVELKADMGDLSPIQQAWHDKLRQHGVRVHTVYGRTGVLNWIRWAVDITGPQSEPCDRAAQV
jgi:hypothetical protein